MIAKGAGRFQRRDFYLLILAHVSALCGIPATLLAVVILGSLEHHDVPFAAYWQFVMALALAIVVVLLVGAWIAIALRAMAVARRLMGWTIAANTIAFVPAVYLIERFVDVTVWL